MYSVEREGQMRFSMTAMPGLTGMILRQLLHTYNLLLFLNSEERIDKDTNYRLAHSFVSLPLVRTMIDGFYNCTAMLDKPERARVYQISGFYRVRESIQADEARYGSDPDWRAYLKAKRESYKLALRIASFTEADLDDKKNEWPLLGAYLKQKPDTPHRQLLRTFTLGFWKEYSSISHASYDGLADILPFIGEDVQLVGRRIGDTDVPERYTAMHISRASLLMLCLLTEIQAFYRFEGPAEIDGRLASIWQAMHPLFEVKKLYESRYKGLLRRPVF